MNKRIRIHTFLMLLLCAVMTMVPAASVLAGTGNQARGVYDYTNLSGWPEAPETSGASIYMIELNSGAVLYDKNSEAKSYPASTTKIMTCLLALENLSLEEEITLSHDATNDLEEGGYHWDFREGDTLTVDECLRFFMVESVNEIGYALAERMGGSLEGFAEMMNARAKELGATNTHFTNPHGLNDENHTTTAKDMAMILWGCVQNEQFRYYASLKSVSGIAIRASREYSDREATVYPGFSNHHKMMDPDSEYYDPDVVCGKTGYTSIAGNTLVTYASRGDMDVVCIIMQGLSDRFDDCRLLLDYAFDNFSVTPTSELAAELNAAVEEPFTLEDSCEPGAAILLPAAYQKSVLTSEFSVSAPDAEGYVTGTRTWKLGELTVGREQMKALAVPETTEAPTQEVQPETEARGSSAEGGFLRSKIFGWRVSDLLILCGLGVLLLILLVLFIVLVHGAAENRREMRRRAKIRRERARREEEDDDIWN